MKLKRDHGYTQHKRLKHERAINKYTSNLQEKNTTTNFITIVIYYIIKNLQINLILKVSSPQRESLRARLHGEFQPGWPGWNFRPASETNPLKTKLSITWRGIQPGLKKEREHAYLSCFRTSVNFLTEISVLRPGWNWPCNRNNISARWAERNFRPGWNSPCNQALREDGRIFSKVLKLWCVHGLSSAAFTSGPGNPYYLSFPFFILSGSSFYAPNLSCKGVTLQLLHLKSWRNWRGIVFHIVSYSKGDFWLRRCEIFFCFLNLRWSRGFVCCEIGQAKV